MPAAEEGASVFVAARVRPFVVEDVGWCCVEVLPAAEQVIIADPHGAEGDEPAEHRYHFHRSLSSMRTPAESTHQQRFVDNDGVWAEVGPPMLARCLAGKAATLLCVGQTGAGKSHTMVGHTEGLGNAVGHDTEEGMIPHMLEAVFEHVDNNLDDCVALRVELSLAEVLCEQVRDLLAPAGKRPGERPPALGCFEHPSTGVGVRGLAWAPVRSVHEGAELLDAALCARALHGCRWNAATSQASLVATLRVTQILDPDPTVPRSHPEWRNHRQYRVGTVTLVDVCGLEALPASHAHEAADGADDNLADCSLGDRSVRNLARCFHALAQLSAAASGGGAAARQLRRQAAALVPWRDSVLTLLLRDALLSSIGVRPGQAQMDEDEEAARDARRGRRSSSATAATRPENSVGVGREEWGGAPFPKAGPDPDGGERLWMIACVSPACDDYEATAATLKFADRVCRLRHVGRGRQKGDDSSGGGGGGGGGGGTAKQRRKTSAVVAAEQARAAVELRPLAERAARLPGRVHVPPVGLFDVMQAEGPSALLRRQHERLKLRRAWALAREAEEAEAEVEAAKAKTAKGKQRAQARKTLTGQGQLLTKGAVDKAEAEAVAAAAEQQQQAEAAPPPEPQQQWPPEMPKTAAQREQDAAEAEAEELARRKEAAEASEKAEKKKARRAKRKAEKEALKLASSANKRMSTAPVAIGLPEHTKDNVEEEARLEEEVEEAEAAEKKAHEDRAARAAHAAANLAASDGHSHVKPEKVPDAAEARGRVTESTRLKGLMDELAVVQAAWRESRELPWGAQLAAAAKSWTRRRGALEWAGLMSEGGGSGEGNDLKHIKHDELTEAKAHAKAQDASRLLAPAAAEGAHASDKVRSGAPPPSTGLLRDRLARSSKAPHLRAFHPDPSLSGRLCFFLKAGETVVGFADGEDYVSGSGVPDEEEQKPARAVGKFDASGVMKIEKAQARRRLGILLGGPELLGRHCSFHYRPSKHPWKWGSVVLEVHRRPGLPLPGKPLEHTRVLLNGRPLRAVGDEDGGGGTAAAGGRNDVAGSGYYELAHGDRVALGYYSVLQVVHPDQERLERDKAEGRLPDEAEMALLGASSSEEDSPSDGEGGAGRRGSRRASKAGSRRGSKAESEKGGDAPLGAGAGLHEDRPADAWTWLFAMEEVLAAEIESMSHKRTEEEEKELALKRWLGAQREIAHLPKPEAEVGGDTSEEEAGEWEDEDERLAEAAEDAMVLQEVAAAGSALAASRALVAQAAGGGDGGDGALELREEDTSPVPLERRRGAVPHGLPSFVHERHRQRQHVEAVLMCCELGALANELGRAAEFRALHEEFHASDLAGMMAGDEKQAGEEGGAEHPLAGGFAKHHPHLTASDSFVELIPAEGFGMGTRAPTVWSVAKARNRLLMCRDMYSAMLVQCGGDMEALDGTKDRLGNPIKKLSKGQKAPHWPRATDPFEDNAPDQLIGRAEVFPAALRELLPVAELTPIVGFEGREVGALAVEITPYVKMGQVGAPRPAVHNRTVVPKAPAGEGGDTAHARKASLIAAAAKSQFEPTPGAGVASASGAAARFLEGDKDGTWLAAGSVPEAPLADAAADTQRAPLPKAGARRGSAGRKASAPYVRNRRSSFSLDEWSIANADLDFHASMVDALNRGRRGHADIRFVVHVKHAKGLPPRTRHRLFVKYQLFTEPEFTCTEQCPMPTTHPRWRHAGSHPCPRAGEDLLEYVSTESIRFDVYGCADVKPLMTPPYAHRHIELHGKHVNLSERIGVTAALKPKAPTRAEEARLEAAVEDGLRELRLIHDELEGRRKAHEVAEAKFAGMKRKVEDEERATHERHLDAVRPIKEELEGWASREPPLTTQLTELIKKGQSRVCAIQ